MVISITSKALNGRYSIAQIKSVGGQNIGDIYYILKYMKSHETNATLVQLAKAIQEDRNESAHNSIQAHESVNLYYCFSNCAKILKILKKKDNFATTIEKGKQIWLSGLSAQGKQKLKDNGISV